jgi:small subunit ribosomal protein S27e
VRQSANTHCLRLSLIPVGWRYSKTNGCTLRCVISLDSDDASSSVLCLQSTMPYSATYATYSLTCQGSAAVHRRARQYGRHGSRSNPSPSITCNRVYSSFPRCSPLPASRRLAALVRRARRTSAEMPALETDLLNPDPAVEAQKHKLKRLVQSPNSFFMDVKCPGCYTMCVSRLSSICVTFCFARRCMNCCRKATARCRSPLLLTSCTDCFSPVLATVGPLSCLVIACALLNSFPQHDCLLARTNSGGMWRVRNGALPADWRTGPAHRGLLLSQEA